MLDTIRRCIGLRKNNFDYIIDLIKKKKEKNFSQVINKLIERERNEKQCDN